MLCSLMKGALLPCVRSQESMPRKGSDINLDSVLTLSQTVFLSFHCVELRAKVTD
jgi:hypothetical protein